jgi:hypothetical protein
MSGVMLPRVSRRIDIDHREVAAVLRVLVGIVATPVATAFGCAVFYWFHGWIAGGVLAVLLGVPAKVIARGYFSFRTRLSRLGYLDDTPSSGSLAVIVRLPLLQYLTLDLAVRLLHLKARPRVGQGRRRSNHTRWMFHHTFAGAQARNCW